MDDVLFLVHGCGESALFGNVLEWGSTVSDVLGFEPIVRVPSDHELFDALIVEG